MEWSDAKTYQLIEFEILLNRQMPHTVAEEYSTI